MGKVYIDERGWKYQIMPGIGTDSWKARYQKPGKLSWRGVASLPWRNNAAAAEADLERLATKKNWKEWKA